MVKQVAGFWDCPLAPIEILCKHEGFASTTGIAYDLPQPADEVFVAATSPTKLANTPRKPCFSTVSFKNLKNYAIHRRLH